MTDPTPPMTTPTRDEAVPTGWRYSINYGPDGEENFANVYAADGQFVGNLRTHHAIAICNAFAVCEKLASAPAPASGGVDAVGVCGISADTESKRVLKLHFKHEVTDADRKTIIDAFNTLNRERRSALSTAATPVSEAETVAWQTVSDFVDEMLRDWSGGDDCRMGFGVNGATVTKGQFRAVRSALASLSPAATPVSEAGGEAAERSWRRTKFEFIGAMRQALINSGLTREQVIIADNAITEAFSDLAKPASSPAPVRPIGNQGISDYQREIARNMAEGFAAWNAARQEALPSDEPASSPAGGEVRRVRHKKRGTTYRVLHGAVMQSTHWRDTHYKVPADGRTVVVYQSEDDGSVWVRPAEEFEDGRFEALSQSASAGRAE